MRSDTPFEASSPRPSEPGAAIRVAVVDGQPLFRAGVALSLAGFEAFRIVGEGESASDALEIARHARPDILLLDLAIKGDGLNAIRAIRTDDQRQKVLVLTASEAQEDLAAAFRAGASGYVLKSVDAPDLARIIRDIAAGGSYVAPSLSATLLAHLSGRVAEPPSPIETLTGREREILELVARGLSNKHVAIALDLHEKTVKHHMTRVLAKLGLVNRTEAALALRDWQSGSLADRRTGPFAPALSDQGPMPCRT